MATTGTVLAKNMKIYVGANAITCQVNATLNQSTEMFDTTCKDSSANAANLPGTKSWSISGTANLAFDATYGYEDLWDAWDGQTSVTPIFQTAVSGDLKFSGDAYISELSLTSDGNDAAVTFDFTLTGTGALTKATVA
jgi:predicted secreted protein